MQGRANAQLDGMYAGGRAAPAATVSATDGRLGAFSRLALEVQY
jgi:hypothetical protein